MNADFHVTSKISPVRIAKSEILRLHEHWQALCDRGRLPSVEDLNWPALGCADDLILVEKESDEVFRYLAYESNVAKAAGFDLTGKTTHDLSSEVGKFFEHCHYRWRTPMVKPVSCLPTIVRSRFAMNCWRISWAQQSMQLLAWARWLTMRIRSAIPSFPSMRLRARCSAATPTSLASAWIRLL